VGGAEQPARPDGVRPWWVGGAEQPARPDGYGRGVGDAGLPA